ncbi:MAG: alanine racemase [Candidatus Omnitrophota bacterium]
MYRPLWIEVDLKALADNLKRIKQGVGKGVKIMVTLKQQAYGHGLLALARECLSRGADFFGLGDLDEAITLRKKGFKNPILILSAVMPADAKEFVKYNVIPTLVDLKFARQLNKQAKKKKKIVGVHIKIDTGMGRLGVWHEESLSFVKKIAALENLRMEGLYTHFPCADTDRNFTLGQIRIFNRLAGALKIAGITFKYLHCANSIGILNYNQAHFNLVRPGLILYGIDPSGRDNNFSPLLSLKSKVIFMKKVDKGRSVSYGRTFIAKEATTIATVAAGYADGYPWHLSNRAKVIINDKVYNVAGRVCMDHIMVDVGKNASAKVNDKVILIGKSRNHKISAEDLASWAGTIPYEIVSRLSLKIPRFYK